MHNVKTGKDAIFGYDKVLPWCRGPGPGPGPSPGPGPGRSWNRRCA